MSRLAVTSISLKRNASSPGFSGAECDVNQIQHSVCQKQVSWSDQRSEVGGQKSRAADVLVFNSARAILAANNQITVVGGELGLVGRLFLYNFAKRDSTCSTLAGKLT